MRLTKKELEIIEGGASFTLSSLLNSIAKIGNSLIDAGRYAGSAIRRLVSGKTCICK